MASHAAPPDWIFFVFPPLLWCAVLAVISLASGWRSLADRFRAESPPPDHRQWMVSGSLGWVDFNSSLVVGHSEAGLHLAAFPLFRPFHPPLLIPWSAISGRVRRRYWLRLCDTLEIAGDRTLQLRLPVGTTRRFERLLPPIAEA